MRLIQHGTADVSTIVRFLDSTDGTPETGVTSATAGLALSYRREGGVNTALTESDLSALDDAHSDGGIFHVGGGYYRVDVPDAAFASGATGVLIHGEADGMVVVAAYHPLVAFNPQDAVRLGLTALPNAAADAAGGLPVSDAGGLDLDAILEDTGTTIPALIAALENLSEAEVNAQVVDALATDTYAEPGQAAPPSSVTVTQMLRFLYFWARNKKDTDGETTNFYADDGSTVAQTQSIAEASGTVTKSKITGGP